VLFIPCLVKSIQFTQPYVTIRKALETLLHNMLMADHISHRLVKPVVVRICELRGTGETMVSYFAEIVSEIREPITIVRKDCEEEKKRQINLKVSLFPFCICPNVIKVQLLLNRRTDTDETLHTCSIQTEHEGGLSWYKIVFKKGR